MICKYCKKTFEAYDDTEVCDDCKRKGNAILDYDEKCEKLNIKYGTFNFLQFVSTLVLICIALFSFGSISKQPEVIFVVAITSGITAILSSIFKAKYGDKIDKYIDMKLSQDSGDKS